MPSFAGRVTLVTGGTSGIDRSTAIAFANEGAPVVITGRRGSVLSLCLEAASVVTGIPWL